MKPNSLQGLYLEQLRDLYNAEERIIKSLTDMIEAAASGRRGAGEIISAECL